MKNCPIAPTAGRAVIRRDEAADKSPGGIIYTDHGKEKPKTGTILAVGCGKQLDNGQEARVQLAVGQKVWFNQYAGNEIEHEGEKYIIIGHDEVLAVSKE